ncbi:hypothetical protein AB0J65_28835 [Streptomyces toxytricini]
MVDLVPNHCSDQHEQRPQRRHFVPQPQSQRQVVEAAVPGREHVRRGLRHPQQVAELGGPVRGQ